MNKEEKLKDALARWEKEQEKKKKKKSEFDKTLKGEDKKKLKAIELAIKTLTDANVPFLMFCQQKHFSSAGEDSIQYNNFGELSKKLGKLENVIEWTHNLTLAIWGYINMMAERKGNIKLYNPVDLWFWGSVKDEYRQKCLSKTKKLKTDYPTQ